MGLQTNHQTCALYREAKLEGKPEIVKEEVRRGVRRLKGMCGAVPGMLKAR